MTCTQIKNKQEFIWEMGVENGTYRVTVGAGDADYKDSYHSITAEGVNILQFVPNSDYVFNVGTGEVEVTDGKLTIGFERTAENQANWTAVDNFELFYVPEKLPTAIETVTVATTKDAPKKFFKNNKVVILKNGKAYNVAGQELK